MSGDPKMGDRHSQALAAELITDEAEKARREARNGILQFDHVTKLIEEFIDPERPFKLRPSTLLALNRTALDGINAYAGNYRPGPVTIGGSKHVPPGAHLVPELVEDLCDYVNLHWGDRSPIHLAAYVMWRLNWIHPFADGNGRTARAVSYLVLCVKSGMRLPGRKTIPEQIATNKRPYYDALESADEAARSGAMDLSALERLLSDLLAAQLVEVHQLAGEAAAGTRQPSDT